MKIKGVSGAEYEEWVNPDISPEQQSRLDSSMVKHDEQVRRWSRILSDTAVELQTVQDNYKKLERQNKSLQDTVVHLTNLIHTFGLCRLETQLARIELGEATEQYVLNKNYDEKNYGAIAKHVLAEMRAKGEMPDEN